MPPSEPEPLPSRVRGSASRRVLTLALALLPALLLPLGSCNGSGTRATRSDGNGPRLRVTLRGYTSGQLFELVSESHTNLVEYYSQPRQDASRKIQADEVMVALLGELEDQGFADHAQAGPAPRSSSGGIVTWGLEVQDGNETRHWLTGKGVEAQEKVAFHECMRTFLQLYNVSASYQAIENPEGPELFDEPLPLPNQPRSQRK